MNMAFIFDVEGTLVDSARQQLACWHETLLAHGRDVPVARLQAYLGMDGNEMLQAIAPDIGESDREALIKQQGSRFEQRYLPAIRSFPGVRETLLALKVKGYRLGLATDCKGASLRHYLAETQIDGLVDVIACGEDAPKGKPDPSLVHQAAAKLGMRSQNCFMVGDTPYDAAAAGACGIAAVGVLTGGFCAKQLLDAGCIEALPAVTFLAGWTGPPHSPSASRQA